MADIALVRSPYIISQSGVAGDTIAVELFLWNDPDSQPVTATYDLDKPIPSSNATTVYFDLSEYAREYIEHINFTFNDTFGAATVTEYCNLHAKVYVNGALQGTTYTLLCFDGYGYHSEGSNPVPSKILMTEGSYLVNSSGDLGDFTVVTDPAEVWTVEYRPLNADFPLYTDTLTDEISVSPYIALGLVGTGGNRVSVLKDAVEQAAFTFVEQCEPKYEVFLCDFVNKFGTWQKLTFFKASKSDFNVMSTEYNLMPDSISYNVNKNTVKTFNINGRDMIKLNTGWVDESYSEVIKQLMLSETIRLNGVPVNITSKSTPLKKGINDKNINYEIGFMYAFDTINNIQ